MFTACGIMHRWCCRLVTCMRWNRRSMPSPSEMEEMNKNLYFTMNEIQSLLHSLVRELIYTHNFLEKKFISFFPRRQYRISDTLLKPTWICKRRHYFWQNPGGSLWVPSALCRRLKHRKCVLHFTVVCEFILHCNDCSFKHIFLDNRWFHYTTHSQ